MAYAHGTAGGIAAGALFVEPSIYVMLVFSLKIPIPDIVAAAALGGQPFQSRFPGVIYAGVFRAKLK